MRTIHAKEKRLFTRRRGDAEAEEEDFATEDTERTERRWLLTAESREKRFFAADLRRSSQIIEGLNKPALVGEWLLEWVSALEVELKGNKPRHSLARRKERFTCFLSALNLRSSV